MNPVPVPRDDTIGYSLQLPLTICFAGKCNSMVYIYGYGQIIIQEQTTPAGSNNIQIVAMAGLSQSDEIAIGVGNYGIFYRVAGPPGNRSVTFAWYMNTAGDSSAKNHFTITMFESRPVAQYKYYGCAINKCSSWTGI